MVRNKVVMHALLAVVLLSLAAGVRGGLADEEEGQSNIIQQVVKGLDLKKYSGRWYEIAKYTSNFEPLNGVNTRVTYSLRADGKVDILSETFQKGEKKAIKGYAYKDVPKSEEAKLKIKYDFVPFFVGDYWVLYVDDAYQYAVVGHPFRISLYILSRRNKIDDKVYNQLVQKAKEQGYAVQALTKTPQTDPPHVRSCRKLKPS